MRLDPGGLWTHRDFRRLWAGQTISVFGSLTTRLALPLTAIIYLHARAYEVALLASFDVVAGLLFGVAAGVWADRLPRRPLMIGADAGRALVLGSVPAAAAFGALGMPQLYLVRFLAGALTVVFDVSYQAYLPTLVSEDELVEGNSKLAATAAVAEFGSFGASGWLVQLLTAPGAIAVDAVSFVFSAGSILAIGAQEPPPKPAHERDPFRAEVAAGLRAVRDDPVLRALAAGMVAWSLVAGVVGATILLYANREMGFSPGALGLIFAVGGVTAFFGAWSAGWWARRLGPGGAMVLGIAFGGIGLALTAAAPGATAVGALLLISTQVIADPFWTVFEINQVSLRQQVAAPAVLGRINGAFQTASMLAVLAGSLAGAGLAQFVDARAGIIAGAGVALCGAVYLLLSPARGVRTAGAPAGPLPATLAEADEALL